MNRLTAECILGDGYWSPHDKKDVINRLGLYEDLGLDPVQLGKLIDRYITSNMIKEVTIR